MRADLADLVARLASLGLDDLSLTTNGMLLAPLADQLAAAASTGSTSAVTHFAQNGSDRSAAAASLPPCWRPWMRLRRRGWRRSR